MQVLTDLKRVPVDEVLLPNDALGLEDLNVYSAVGTRQTGGL